jgi:translation initiation factor 2 gamma subunit (eIF-2gamma)
MIKLVELLNELDKPENVYEPGYSPEEQDKEFLKRGYRMTGTTIDPETGKSSSNVEQLAQFERISNELSDIMAQIRPLKRLIAGKKDTLIKQIKTKATDIVSDLGRAQTAINDLKGFIEMLKDYNAE